MSNDIPLRIIFRPLANSRLSGEFPISSNEAPEETALEILRDCLGMVENPLDVASRRYEEITDETAEPSVVPQHESIMRHVLRPLIEAKQCYVLGMPVACIAQAGLVGEMVALWRFRMLETKIDGRPLDIELQKRLWGREFDKLGQETRVQVLRALDSLDDEMIESFDKLRLLRRQYLHFMVEIERNIDQDACKAYTLAATLVTRTLNVSTVNNGRLRLPPSVMKYIMTVTNTTGNQPVP